GTAPVAEVMIGNTHTNTLFDTGTIGINIISKNFVQTHRIPTTTIIEPKPILMTTKGSKTTAYETAEVQVSVKSGQIPWKVVCQVLPINEYDLILGMPFMHKHQLKIDAGKGTIEFPTLKYMLYCAQRPISMGMMPEHCHGASSVGVGLA